MEKMKGGVILPERLEDLQSLQGTNVVIFFSVVLFSLSFFFYKSSVSLESLVVPEISLHCF